MARYIDADLLLKKLFPYDVVDKKQYAINAQAVYNAIEGASTADVVPKSEAERWRYSCECRECGKCGWNPDVNEQRKQERVQRKGE